LLKLGRFSTKISPGHIFSLLTFKITCYLMKLSNYNTTNLHTKFSTQNSVYPFIKLWETRSAEFLFICDSTPPSGTATTVAMPIFSSQCHTSLHYVATPFLLLSSRHHVNRQEFSSAVIYTSTANVQMKSRIALRNSSRLLLLLLQLLLLQLLRHLQNYSSTKSV